MTKLLNALATIDVRHRAIAGIGVLLLGLTILAGPAFSGERSDDPLGVAVSPQMLIIGAVQGSVSVHTDIPYGSVDKTKSVTLNGVLLRKGIPTVSRFGGVLEVANGRPVRFTDVIYYDGTTLDPLEVFIKGGLTSVREAARTGHGRIGASFREVPTEAIHEVEEITRELDRIGLNGVFLIGRPNQPLLDFPVHHGRTGMVAAIEESGIETTSVALASLLEFGDLVYYENLIAPRIASPPLG